MPPYQPLRGRFQLKSDLISGLYFKEDLLLFLSEGSIQNCLQHLSSTCDELTKTYGNLSNLASDVEFICNHRHHLCKKLPMIKEKLCDTEDVTYPINQKTAPLDSSICFEFYIYCRLRSAGCSSQYSEKCHELLFICHSNHKKDGFLYFFSGLSDNGYSSKKFREELKDICRDLYNISDVFVKLCLNPYSLESELETFTQNQKEGKGGFASYPQLSSAALLGSQGLDGGLFSPGTQDGTNPLFLLGYLVSQSSSTSFVDACKEITQKCFGLGFFPRTAPFCEINSHQASGVNCQEAEIKLMEQDIPKLKHELHTELRNGEHSAGFSLTGISPDLCQKFLVSCSYLGGLDSSLQDLCNHLQAYCAYALELGSSLSVFEYYFREQDAQKNSGHKPNSCEQKLQELCPTKANTSVDFLAFCLKPSHTCTALQELVKLRCDQIKEGFTATNSAEVQCVNLLLKYDVYRNECQLTKQYIKFITKCSASYPKNKYLAELAASTSKELTPQEENSKERGNDDDDDGF
ncbi:hypothetical protein MERGE_000609 [Pneumocystis wakefieldiae]|uniref:Uncharacterized protein n=1 Tax=Pneumocystis wakefieldiae TaxID=38082 RepID=A0A899G107_9ASCO|nr:hypothetical protein MERGE_000609 [Pneumocystis wakefieldiae]